MKFDLAFPVVVALSLASAACEPAGSSRTRFPAAQALVEQVAARHPDVERLTIHTVPRGERESRVIASTLAEKLGQRSDLEDLAALASGKETVQDEGSDIDVTLPIRDAAGKAIAATGVTFRGAGRTREQALTEARVVEAELAQGILASREPMW